MVLENGRDHPCATGSIERLACRCHLVQHCAQCENVGPTIGLSALQLFGRHVGDCAKDRAIVGDCLRRSGRMAVTRRLPFRRGQLRDAEVEQLHAIACQHDI
jgi:hypothetical protein